MTERAKYGTLVSDRVLPRRFRRRQDVAIVMGVCAGIADYFDIDRLVVRVVALLALWLFTVPTMLLYLILAWLGDS